MTNENRVPLSNITNDDDLSKITNDENLPGTQTIGDVVFTQSQALSPPKVWGKLFSMNKNINSVDLVGDSYTFGRSKDCNVSYDEDNFRMKVLSTISKLHFRIVKEKLIGSDGYEQPIAFIEDYSQNGTFVNYTKVGKNNKIKLRNDDIIAMSDANLMKVYIYMDASGLEAVDFPNEVTSKFAMSRKLGSGACGEVLMAFSKSTNEKVAIKIITKKDIEYNALCTDEEKILNEIEILKKLEHPCVINMVDFIDTPLRMYIVLELMEGGELLDRIRKKGRISEKHTKILFYQVALAVQYLHSKGIAHRDLKPENILLASNDEETLVKVTDFGLSKLVNASMMKTFCGTYMYAAPEILINRGRAVYTKQIDIWSMGVILYCCLSGITPFTASNKCGLALADQIIKGMYNFPRQFSDVSPNAISLIKRMMTVDPDKRLKINDVINSSWFVDRTMRITVTKIFDRFSMNSKIQNLFERMEMNGVAKRARISMDDD